MEKESVRLMFFHIVTVLGPSRIHRSTIVTLSAGQCTHADTDETQVSGAEAEGRSSREEAHGPSCHNA